jgi:hypothetical protein
MAFPKSFSSLTSGIDMHRLFALATLAGILAHVETGRAWSADLTAAEQELLPYLDKDMVADCVHIGAEIPKWRDRIKAIRDQAKKMGQDAIDLDDKRRTQEPIQLVLDISQILAKTSPKLRERFKFIGTMEAKLKEAEKLWRETKFDPDVYFDLEEKTFREELKEIALGLASQQILKDIE